MKKMIERDRERERNREKKDAIADKEKMRRGYEQKKIFILVITQLNDGETINDSNVYYSTRENKKIEAQLVSIFIFHEIVIQIDMNDKYRRLIFVMYIS